MIQPRTPAEALARGALQTCAVGGHHPITLFVHAAAAMLASAPDRLEVRETLAGEARDYLLVEVVPQAGDFGKILGAGGVILDAVRLVAKRMAQRDGLTVEIKLRDPRPRT